MKFADGNIEDGIVVGNVYDKYRSTNPLVQHIMNGFTKSLTEYVDKSRPQTIHEIGCGEGYWVIKWNTQGIQSRGSDFSKTVINIARENAQMKGIPSTQFTVRSIYALDETEDSADLIVCCEVLEHLDDPEEALLTLQRVVTNTLIISVPQEPLWRLLNVLRGKYLTSLGNTPGHIQHWSSKEIVQLVAKYFKIVEIKRPLPWTMLLCKPTC